MQLLLRGIQTWNNSITKLRIYDFSPSHLRTSTFFLPQVALTNILTVTMDYMNPCEKSHTTSVFDIGFITRWCYFHTLLGKGRLARSRIGILILKSKFWWRWWAVLSLEGSLWLWYSLEVKSFALKWYPWSSNRCGFEVSRLVKLFTVLSSSNMLPPPHKHPQAHLINILCYNRTLKDPKDFAKLHSRTFPFVTPGTDGPGVKLYGGLRAGLIFLHSSFVLFAMISSFCKFTWHLLWWRKCKHKSSVYIAFSIVIFAFPSLAVSPTIAAISPNQTINETDDVTLSCQAKGIPSPTITWLKADDEKKNLSSSSELSLKNINRDQDGLYLCIANNRAGKAIAYVAVAVHCEYRICVRWKCSANEKANIARCKMLLFQASLNRLFKTSAIG